MICEACSLTKVDYYLQYHNQYQRESMIHHQHALAIFKYKPEFFEEHGKPFDIRVCKVQHTNLKTILNGLYQEGKRAVEEGDFKEDQDVLEIQHSCDACERNIDEIRYQCLNCRSLILCEDCYRSQVDDLKSISNSGNEQSSTIAREHKEDHVFLRLFDYMDIELR